MYNPGDSVNMSNGGVVFRGSVQKLTDRLDIIEQKLKENQTLELAKTQNKSASYMASQHFLQKKQNMKEMG